MCARMEIPLNYIAPKYAMIELCVSSNLMNQNSVFLRIGGIKIKQKNQKCWLTCEWVKSGFTPVLHNQDQEIGQTHADNVE